MKHIESPRSNYNNQIQTKPELNLENKNKSYDDKEVQTIETNE